MDNSEFESRAFADPGDTSQDFLDAMHNDPRRRQLLDEIRSFDRRLGRAFNGIPVPSGLADKVKATLPAGTGTDGMPATRGFLRPVRLLAISMSLVLVAGLTYSSLFDPNQPSAAELAFGQQVIDHVYLERAEIDASQGVNFQLVNEVMGEVGGRLPDDASINELQIRFARLCDVIPRLAGAHLVIAGDLGQIDVILVRNSPVRSEFFIADEHFDSFVVPVAEGNLVLVGEKQEPLADYRQALGDHLEWAI